MAYQHTAASEWVWRDGAKHYAVRVFTKTRNLIWSSWTETSEAPIFDQGVTQSFEDFLCGDTPPNSPPQALIDELRGLIADEAKVKRGLFFRRK